MAWRRFLFVHELLRTFDEESAVAALRANTTSHVEHLVEFLSDYKSTRSRAAIPPWKRLLVQNYLARHAPCGYLGPSQKSRTSCWIGQMYLQGRTLQRPRKYRDVDASEALWAMSTSLFPFGWSLTLYDKCGSLLAEISSPKRKVGWSTKRDGSRSDDRETLQNRLSVECRSIKTTSMLTNFERRTGSSLSDLPMKDFSSKKSGVLASSGLDLRQKWKSRFQQLASLYDKRHCTLKAYRKVGQWTLKVLGGSDFVKLILHFKTLLSICKLRASERTFSRAMTTPRPFDG